MATSAATLTSLCQSLDISKWQTLHFPTLWWWVRI